MRLVLIFHRFGPYHLARLRGCVSAIPDTIGLELSGEDNTYEWADRSKSEDLSIQTVFPNQDTDSLSYQVVKDQVYTHLDQLMPTVVAVPGWVKNGALAAVSWCVENKVPAVLLSESTYIDHERQLVKETVKRWIVSLFSSALVGGEKHAEYLVKLGVEKSQVFYGYNIVDNDYFSDGVARIRANSEQVRQEMGLPEKYFIFCARFIEEKNIDKFIDAYQLYWQNESQPWSLVLVGDGELRSSIETKVQKLACGKDVYFPGFTQIEELPSYYGLASGFILPSQVEPWGLVVNEAMAAGLPVLVSNHCGSSELVEEGENGWCFSPESVDEMSELMSRLTHLPDEQYQSFCSKSEEIIANHGPGAFGRGMKQAAEVAIENGSRKMSVLAWLAILVTSRRR